MNCSFVLCVCVQLYVEREQINISLWRVVDLWYKYTEKQLIPHPLPPPMNQKIYQCEALWINDITSKLRNRWFPVDPKVCRYLRYLVPSNCKHHTVTKTSQQPTSVLKSKTFQLTFTRHVVTRMHSSGMCTVCCSGRLSCHAHPHHACRLPSSHCPPSFATHAPSFTTHTSFTTHLPFATYPTPGQNYWHTLVKTLPFPQLLLQTVKIYIAGAVLPQLNSWTAIVILWSSNETVFVTLCFQLCAWSSQLLCVWRCVWRYVVHINISFFVEFPRHYVYLLKLHDIWQ